MAQKKFTQKAGYENALDFDPENGIVKFGSYEAFVKDLGIKPQREEFKYQDYLKNVTSLGTATRELAGMTSADRDKKMREQFERDVTAGTVPKAPERAQYTGVAIPRENRTGPIGGYSNPAPAAPSFRKVERLGPDSFAVEEYSIPNDQVKGYELLNEISRRAAGLARSGQRPNNDALRQNQQDAAARRQGRASTVLSGINT